MSFDARTEIPNVLTEEQLIRIADFALILLPAIIGVTNLLSLLHTVREGKQLVRFILSLLTFGIALVQWLWPREIVLTLLLSIYSLVCHVGDFMISIAARMDKRRRENARKKNKE